MKYEYIWFGIKIWTNLFKMEKTKMEMKSKYVFYYFMYGFTLIFSPIWL